MKNTISHSERVYAPLLKVWEHLLFKIDNPDKFVPGVSNVEILEKSAASTIRKMNVAMPTGAIVLTEKITAAPYWVRFEIIEHPSLSGYIENHAEAIDENTTLLTYHMNHMSWAQTANNQTANNPEILKSAVLKSKHFIEGR